MTRTITTLSSREFSQNTRRAKKKARTGPVFITDRGRPTHVLMTIDDYQALTGGPMMLAAALAQPESADIEFEPPRLRGPLSRRVDFA
ncbi:MAG: type II toxin-antitoxin system Phd/YefM family antitoxin [Gammaproteobacteria bacterium]|nr:MAG: type II toxin-antitoxin system Phd/YefM family antitoxin [Gammaproteobacteria bacterium]